MHPTPQPLVLACLPQRGSAAVLRVCARCLRSVHMHVPHAGMMGPLNKLGAAA